MHCPKQTDDEYITEFSLWTLTQSPLIVSTDVRNLTSVMQSALLNDELVAAHQSTSTPPGEVAVGFGAGLCDGCQVWRRSLSLNGEAPAVLAAFVNWRAAGETGDMTVTWEQLGVAAGTGNVAVRDLWLHEDWSEPVAADAGGLTVTGVPPGGTVVLKITPQA